MVALNPLISSQLFRSLHQTVLNEIAGFAREESYHVDEPIYHDKDQANRLYILEDGEVNEYLAAGQPPGILMSAITLEGEAFGLSSLLDSRRHSTSAICLRQTKVISIDAEALRELLDRKPDVGYAVTRGLAETLDSRLRDAREQIENMLSASSLGPGQPSP